MSQLGTAEGYPPELAIAARRTCLHVATILGDLSGDIIVVGGLVPYLIIDQNDEAIAQHVGTRDLDLGLSLGVLEEEQYKQVSQRLREQDYRPGKNEKGNTTRQTWQHPESKVTIDFLIPPTEQTEGQRIQDLEKDFAAMIMPALPLAFEDAVSVTIDDETIMGERAKRDVRVCGPAGFVGMKAHACRLRAKNKDPYDLIYMLKHHGDGTTRDVAVRFVELLDHPAADEAIALLEEDFASTSHVGPMRYARFLVGGPDKGLQADAHGYVDQFLQEIKRARA
jgi:hypothetical protein